MEGESGVKPACGGIRRMGREITLFFIGVSNNMRTPIKYMIENEITNAEEHSVWKQTLISYTPRYLVPQDDIVI